MPRDGKPRKRVVDRLKRYGILDAVDAGHFDGAELRAYYFAHCIESPSCWPRVLAGTMEQDRFHARAQRMMQAILRVTNSATME